MQEIPHKNGRDYSNVFLGIVLLGLVLMVVGLMMASTRSQSARGKPQTPSLYERGSAVQLTVPHKLTLL